MAHQNTLELTRTALVVIDMQEAFRSKISHFAEIAARIAIVSQAASLLELPIIVTEQYPKGLGHTAAEVSSVLPKDLRVIEKTAFSSCGASDFQKQLESTRRKQILVCGIEAHICVNQTVHDLLAGGFQVHLLRDCVSSRNKVDRKTAFRKMEMSGAIPSTVEMALFELMRDARHEQFKSIQGLIK